MPCDKDRKVAVGFKDPKEESEVRRAPRISPSRSLRQRDELRRSEPPSQRSADQAQGARRRNSRLRVKERMRICVYTAASSSHGRAMGGRWKNCQEPTPTGGRQRAPNCRRARHSPRRHRGHNELEAAGSHQPRSKRRRGPNTRAPADRLIAPQHCGLRTRRVSVACGDGDLSRQSGKRFGSDGPANMSWGCKFGANGTSSNRRTSRNETSSSRTTEDNLPPQEWLVGRVIATHAGEDGMVRVVEIRTSTGVVFRRPIHKLAPLPMC
ncbi:uncharacterized protein LOC117192795 [Drosophila miranda]|uniref:uncharacterized protein LOC117192795 n=1 Tax=Drosophila miranda TaxID=7229 RepID=UPI00143F5692|nr:uncharacterized protein LOC117192795 [Drosophila miranda]